MPEESAKAVKIGYPRASAQLSRMSAQVPRKQLFESQKATSYKNIENKQKNFVQTSWIVISNNL